MVEIKVKQIEIQREEPKIDLSIFKKRSNSKTFRGYLIGKIKQARDEENPEIVQLLSHLYKKYNELEIEGFKPKRWRGKSGVLFIEHPDYVLSIRHKKTDIGEKPQEVHTELSRKSINKVLETILKLDKGKPLKTSEIAEETYQRAWKTIFSDRPTHIKLTEIFNYLEYKGKIKYYRSGRIKLIGKENK
jgi:hypothetical protein